MVDILSINISDTVMITTDIDIIDITIREKLASIMFNIVQQCSSQIFQVCVFIYTISNFFNINI